MKAIRSLLPHENIVYVGDTAHLPYGTKSRDTILRYSLEIATFLSEQDIKVLVVACHTACSFALSELQKKIAVPVLGITTATIEEVARTPANKMALLATRGTISSGMYQNALQNLIPIPCPLLVSLVEEGYIDHPLTELAIQEYLLPLKNQKIDTLILGCTHFPLLQSQIQRALPSHIQIIDPSKHCAMSLKKLLEDRHLLNSQTSAPHYQFFVSDDPEKFRLLGNTFLGSPIEQVHQM